VNEGAIIAATNSIVPTGLIRVNEWIAAIQRREWSLEIEGEADLVGGAGMIGAIAMTEGIVATVATGVTVETEARDEESAEIAMTATTIAVRGEGREIGLEETVVTVETGGVALAEGKDDKDKETEMVGGTINMAVQYYHEFSYPKEVEKRSDGLLISIFIAILGVTVV